MQFHQVCILFSCLHVTERDLPVAPLILREMNEIKDTDMDALLQFLVIVTFFDLTGVNLAHIKQYPIRPVLKVWNLHLHVHPASVFQFHQYVQYSQLVIL